MYVYIHCKNVIFCNSKYVKIFIKILKLLKIIICELCKNSIRIYFLTNISVMFLYYIIKTVLNLIIFKLQ